MTKKAQEGEEEEEEEEKMNACWNWIFQLQISVHLCYNHAISRTCGERPHLKGMYIINMGNAISRILMPPVNGKLTLVQAGMLQAIVL